MNAVMSRPGLEVSTAIFLDLGRLGRLLRPRRAADAWTENGLRAAGAGHRHQPVRPARRSSTTRCCSFDAYRQVHRGPASCGGQRLDPTQRRPAGPAARRPARTPRSSATCWPTSTSAGRRARRSCCPCTRRRDLVGTGGQQQLRALAGAARALATVVHGGHLPSLVGGRRPAPCRPPSAAPSGTGRPRPCPAARSSRSRRPRPAVGSPAAVSRRVAELTTVTSAVEATSTPRWLRRSAVARVLDQDQLQRWLGR